ncbi:MAG: hypothetical protein KIT00_08705 [Rhodospirillales bacterium]|nr:hypothetical protein [Rhodospirillales bacterium]
MMFKGRAIHNSGYDRKTNDFYATPAWVTEALLRHVTLRDSVWEPCCGTGAMSSVLQDNGYEVFSTDIADHGFGTPGIDVLTCREMPDGCRSLVTNPPYGDGGPHRAQQRSGSAMLNFVRHGMSLAESVRGQLALLVRFQWIAGKRASALLSSGPCVAVIALTERITWFEMGEDTNRAQHHHAWIVFDYASPKPVQPALLFAE